MARRVENGVARAFLDDAPLMHDDDAVCDLLDDGEIVGDEEAGETELRLQVGQKPQHLRADSDIQCRDRLVGDDEGGPADERARDRHALALAAGKLVRETLGEGWVQRHVGQRLLDAARIMRGRYVGQRAQPLGHQRTDLHARIERRERVLEDHLAIAAVIGIAGCAGLDAVTVEEHPSALMPRQAGDHARQRRLAGS